MLELFQQLGEGAADPFGRGMFAGLQFPADDPSFERNMTDALVRVAGRVPFFSGNSVIGVVLIRYDPGGSLAPHCDDPERYGDTVLTVKNQPKSARMTMAVHLLKLKLPTVCLIL